MIREGLVVAYPTDTLYGLAVDPRNADAVRRLYRVEGAVRELGADADRGGRGARARGGGHDAARRAAGGAVLAGAADDCRAGRGRSWRASMLGGRRTVGIRIPDHVVAVALARDAGFCVTATSANRSGATAAATPAAVAAALPDVDAILDAGAARGGAPSTIVDASARDVALVRQGVVPWERVLKSLQ